MKRRWRHLFVADMSHLKGSPMNARPGIALYQPDIAGNTGTILRLPPAWAFASTS
jgi:hypothetical protein